MEEPKDRLKRAREAAGYKSPSAAWAANRTLGKDLLISNENGNRPISRKAAEKYAEAFNVKAGWILYGEGEAPQRDIRYVPVTAEGFEIDPDQPIDGAGYNRESYAPDIPGALPELDVRAGAGEGMVGEIVALPMGGGTVAAHKVVDEWYLPARYLREAVRDPGQSIVMAIDGDSMMPNYAPGDRVVIDLSQDRFESDGVYLISYDLRPPQVKRLQAIPLTIPPKVAIKSDNPTYTTYEVEVDLLRIHGRVCAYVGRR